MDLLWSALFAGLVGGIAALVWGCGQLLGTTSLPRTSPGA